MINGKVVSVDAKFKESSEGTIGSVFLAPSAEPTPLTSNKPINKQQTNSKEPDTETHLFR